MFRMREISITRLGIFERDKINMGKSLVQATQSVEGVSSR